MTKSASLIELVDLGDKGRPRFLRHEQTGR